MTFRLVFLATGLLGGLSAQAVNLKDYKPYSYEVLFTNPECGPHKLETPVKTIGGGSMTQTKEGVYCLNRVDRPKSTSWKKSPQNRLVEWINSVDASKQEIFLTYLSYRNQPVHEALVAAGKRGVKIRFVLQSTEDHTLANELVAKGGAQFKPRGSEGGIGYAHNKIFMIMPKDADKLSEGEIKIVFSSGNMTSGPVVHHENWNFVTTNLRSHFAQAHLCAMNGEWNDSSGRSRDDYMRAMDSCRNKIKAPEEDDIKVFFVPGEGDPNSQVSSPWRKPTAWDYMYAGDTKKGTPGLRNAREIWLACHRFFYSRMLNALNSRMQSSQRPELRIIADDDTYYKHKFPNFAGDTHPAEWENMERLQKKGADVRLMATNQDEHQLHHNKYLIFDDKAVMTGAANLTGAGFNTNWENIYYITIPEVVSAFRYQYENVIWNRLSSSVRDLAADPFAVKVKQ